MDDTITTANGVAGITFEDHTQVHITAQSKLVIDTFVYDPDKSTGKLAIKIALGTVKYTSGQIAKTDPQKVAVETPTATIGVRGTDFSSTVDEIGRSQIILLPSCPPGWKNIERDCKTGKIVVMTDAGEVWLTQAFQGTAVESRSKLPSKPVVLDLNLNQINNLLIVSPPEGLKRPDLNVAGKQKNVLDENLLDVDELEYDGLDENQLSENLLDKDFLAQSFLEEILNMLRPDLGDELDQFGSLLPKYDPATGLKYYTEIESVNLYRESMNHYAEVYVPVTSALTLNINQESVAVKQLVNSPGTTIITINQSQ